MPRQMPLAFALRERFTLDRFVVGNNAELLANVCRPVDGFYCAWVWGRAGAGKSHLLQAVSHAHGGAFVPATEIPAAEGYEIFDRILIDDIHAWIGDPAAEDALMRLYINRFRARSRPRRDRGQAARAAILRAAGSRFPPARCGVFRGLSAKRRGRGNGAPAGRL